MASYAIPITSFHKDVLVLNYEYLNFFLNMNYKITSL